MSIGEVCQTFSLSPPTARNILDANPHLGYVSVGRHRRYDRRKLTDFLNITTPIGESGQSVVPLALVCRVSGNNQARKSSPTAECSSLEHQQQRVEDFAQERFGQAAFDHATRYYRVGGGLNHEHPVLVQLVSDILNGKFRNGYIVCQDSIRLMRFGEGLFRQICTFGQCEIVYAMEVDRTDAEVDLSESILSILCHFTARASGMRAKKILEICVSEQDLVRIYTQYKQGISYKDLAGWCAESGITGTKGERLSPAKLCQLLNRNHKILNNLIPTNEPAFMDFWRNNVIEKNGEVLLQTELYGRYVEWCQQNNQTPISAKKMSVQIKNMCPRGGKKGGSGIRWGRHGGYRAYFNIVLRTK